MLSRSTLISLNWTISAAGFGEPWYVDVSIEEIFGITAVVEAKFISASISMFSSSKPVKKENETNIKEIVLTKFGIKVVLLHYLKPRPYNLASQLSHFHALLILFSLTFPLSSDFILHTYFPFFFIPNIITSQIHITRIWITCFFKYLLLF